MANVHCAYCHSAYEQIGFPDLEIQVHNSWLFLPWHRFYLYFYERILGKLIDNETFTLPFWNWGARALEGIQMPSIYIKKSSSLYDKLRIAWHHPSALVDLDFNRDDPGLPYEQQVDRNLKIMYHQVISRGKMSFLFMGSPYCAGDKTTDDDRSLEKVP
ncbi:hypothetical protein ZIOFF_062007 [Zingiber officinale]|uniref:Tyrosinase copper-binding domain-containing protein n=1 Tax=Zingiber officinale TaxID=94328 RepID=A0A8J5F961_ZINOF|nr:hypothetical protein ZIOFF_062007 [Zingiber officinale]